MAATAMAATTMGRDVGLSLESRGDSCNRGVAETPRPPVYHLSLAFRGLGKAVDWFQQRPGRRIQGDAGVSVSGGSSPNDL
jgi:hypothetical protein